MTLGNETTAGVDNDAVHRRGGRPSLGKGVGTAVDELGSLARWAELKSVVRNELIGREAVVELADANVLGGDASNPEWKEGG